MNIEMRIQEAMARIESMSIEELEKEFASYGYNPIRKVDFSFTDENTIAPTSPHRSIRSKCVAYSDLATSFDLAMETSNAPIYEGPNLRFAA